MRRQEWLAIAMAIALVIVIGTGTAAGVWQGTWVRQYSLDALIVCIAGALIWGFRGRFEAKGRSAGRSKFSILMNGPVSVQEGSTYEEMSFHVRSGDLVHGNANERTGRTFDLTVRSRNASRRAKDGESPPILFHARGSSSSIGIPATLSADTYVFRFEPIGDSSGREIVVYLVANHGSRSVNGDSESNH